MKRIDREIFEVEQRIAMRKAAIERAGAQARTRATQKLTTPPALAAAAAIGFVAARALRARPKPLPRRRPGRRAHEQAQRKGFALGTVLMTGLTWVIRTQFGGPVGLAQFVVGKLRERGRSTPLAAPAQIPR